MNIKKYFEEHKNKKILCVLGTVIVALVIFQAGIFVGYHKAAYSYKWGEKYYKTFGERGQGGQREGFAGGREHGFGVTMGFGHMDPSNSHGTIGTIISIALPSIIIEDQDRIEKTVVLTEDTVLRSFRNEINPTDLKVGDSVVIIGNPNEQAQIEARLVRVMPQTQAPIQAQAVTGTTTAQ